MDNRKIVAFFLCIAFLIFPVYVLAAKGVLSKNTKLCLDCHVDKTLNKKLLNKEILPLSIDVDQFTKSVHAKTGCSGCHPDIKLDNHPIVKRIKSRAEYAAALTKNCPICHTSEQLAKKNPLHSSLVVQGTCVGCHGSHYIARLVAQKVGVKENQYCMTCHKSKISMRMKNGDSISVYIDQNAFSNSAHGKLQCIDCHTKFSKTRHPVKKLNSMREYNIVTSGLCKSCHEQATTLYEISAHNSALKTGNLNAPVCTDCHGAHQIVSTKIDKTIGLRSCNKCHMDMNNSYAASIHGIEMKKGNLNAPVCSSCHKAHDIESSALSTKIKDGCLTCHKDAGKAHNKWLSNQPIALPSFAEAHFDAVSCATCHSSTDSQRAVFLSIYNRKTDQPLPEDEILKALETDSEGLIKKFDANGDGSIDAKESWAVFVQLFKKGYISTLIGKMDVRTAEEAHKIGAKTEAIKNCELCHVPDAELFKNVFIAIKKEGEKPILLNADKGVLSSVLSILPMSKFYVLGSTSIELFDILFIVALIGGIAVPIGHITIRVLFTPIRSLRRMGKGGKKQ